MRPGARAWTAASASVEPPVRATQFGAFKRLAQEVNCPGSKAGNGVRSCPDPLKQLPRWRRVRSGTEFSQQLQAAEVQQLVINEHEIG